MSLLSIKIESWLQRIEEIEKLPSKVKAIYIGIFENEENYIIYFSGSNHFDLQDEDWICSQDYFPNEKYLDSGVSTKENWEEFLNTVIEALKKISNSKSNKFIDSVKNLACGFDSGDLHYIKHENIVKKKNKDQFWLVENVAGKSDIWLEPVDTFDEYEFYDALEEEMFQLPTPLPGQIQKGELLNDWILAHTFENACSLKMKGIIDKFAHNIKWIPISFQFEGEEKEAFLIHKFPYDLDLLSQEHSTFVSGRLYEPVLDKQKTKDSNLILLGNTRDPIICDKLKRDLEENNCTGIKFSKVKSA